MTRFHSVAVPQPFPVLQRRHQPEPTQPARPEDKAKRALSLRRREARAEAQRQAAYTTSIEQSHLF